MPNRPKALCTGTLAHLGINADCYVLDLGDGQIQRVLSQRGIIRALTASTDEKTGRRSGGRESGSLDAYVRRLPNGDALLTSGAEIEFELPQGGAVAIGRTADWFMSLLRAYKAAWRNDQLHGSQVKLAKAADAMLDALAGVGLAALIDEVTGYQKLRAPDGLANLYGRLLRMKAAEWEKTWPSDLITSLSKTYRIRVKPTPEIPVPAPLLGVIGWIYRIVMTDEVHGETRRRNPKGGNGHRSVRHHQFWQDDLRKLVTEDFRVIKALSDTSRDAEEFRAKMLAHFRREPMQLGLH